MDPVGMATSIAKLAFQAAVALGNLRDLARDSATLARLVRRVGMVVQDAALELDAGQLSRKSAIDALQVWIANCAALVNLLAGLDRVAFTQHKVVDLLPENYVCNEQGLKDSMTECISFVERLGRKTTIVKFFTAGASGYYRWVIISHYGRYQALPRMFPLLF